MIRFIDDPVEGSRIGNALMHGEIVLGETREEFESFIGFWSPADYAVQWRAGAARAAIEGRDACLITSITDPSDAEYLRWWLLYPRGDTIIAQEALLLLNDLVAPFSTVEPYRSIPSYAREADEGQAISEWVIPVRAVRDFVSTSRGG